MGNRNKPLHQFVSIFTGGFSFLQNVPIDDLMILIAHVCWQDPQVFKCSGTTACQITCCPHVSRGLQVGGYWFLLMRISEFPLQTLPHRKSSFTKKKRKTVFSFLGISDGYGWKQVSYCLQVKSEVAHLGFCLKWKDRLSISYARQLLWALQWANCASGWGR